MRRLVPLILLALVVLPATVLAEEAKDAPQRFTLKAKEVEIRDVLQMIGRQAGYSLILDRSIRGTVAVELVNVPHPVALRAFAAAHGLVVVPWHKGHKLYVVTPLDKAKDVLRSRGMMERLDEKGLPKPQFRAIEKRLDAIEKRLEKRRGRGWGHGEKELRRRRIIKMKKREAMDGPPAFGPPGPHGPYAPPMGWHGPGGRTPPFRGPAPDEEIIEEEVETR